MEWFPRSLIYHVGIERVILYIPVQHYYHLTSTYDAYCSTQNENLTFIYKLP